MGEHIYKTSELVGSSRESVEDAVNQAVARASQTLRNLRWFQVSEIRGTIEEDSVGYWQVMVKIGFTLED